MEFDEYDYLEKTVENPEIVKSKEAANGGDDTVKSSEKDSSRSSKHRSSEKDDEDDHHRSKRLKSGDESRRDRERRRSRSRDAEREHRRSSRDKDRDRDKDREKDKEREERNGKERDRERDRDKEQERDHDRERERERDRHRDRDRRERDRESEREREREREQSRRSRSRSERHRSVDERDREKSKERERERERDREKERDRESRRYKEKKEDAAEPEADPERDQRTVFAYQICLKADERDVYEFFSRAGKVRDVRLIMDRNSRRSKGVGYIEFYDVMSVPMAIALSGQLLRGQPVMVKPSEAEKNLVQSTTAVNTGSGPYSGGARRLYVGNLHFHITEDQLRQVFEPFGTVELVQLPLDETGNCKGFGFVQFSRLEDAKNALNLNGQVDIAGRPIKVSTVTDQTGMQEGGTNGADFDDDDGGGLSLNARSRALLMQKLDRSGIASSITGSLGTSVVTNGLAGPAVATLGAGTAVPPVVSSLMPGPVPSLPGLPGTGIQLPGAVPSVDVIGVPSECLLLKNMFDPSAETEPDFDLDIKEDVQEECSKFGNLKHIHVDKNSAGFVYLRFDITQAAMNAQRALHGRWFAGKMITASYMVPQVYENQFPESR